MGMVGGGQRSSSGVIRRTLDRLYERHGVAGLIITGYAVTGTAVSLLVVVMGTAALDYNRETWQENLHYFVLNESLVVAALAIGAYATRDSLRMLLSWSGAARTPERAADVWRVGITGPRQLAVRTGIAFYAPFLLQIAVWPADFGWPAWLVGPLAVGWGLLIAATCVAGMLGVEFLLRPAMEDIGAHLPPDFEPVGATLPLRIKAIVPIPGVVFFAVALTAGFVDTSADAPTRFLTSLGVFIALSVLVVPLFLLLTHAALDPIDLLTAATKRVRDGDLVTRVPVVTADELGTLAVSFNQMLNRMQRHDSELRDSRARIVAAADAERRRVERDLHDGAQQRLVLINLKLEMLSRAVGDNPAADALLEEVRSDAERAVDELRDLAHGIYPPLLESDGLAAALEDVADDSPIPVDVRSDGTGRYPSPVEAAVYFCCLEALQNAAKHAGTGSHVHIDLAEHDGRLHFRVTDDGRGFDPLSINGSGGVQNMTDRIGALGGTVRIDSAPGQGTTVEGTVPL